MSARPLIAMLAPALTVLVAMVVASPSASASGHQVCRTVGQIVICRVVNDPPPSHGGNPGSGPGNGQCTNNGMTIPCYIPGDGTWDATHSCYATPMNPPPPFSDPVWGGHTTGVVMRCVGGQGAGFFWSPNGGNAAPPPALALAQQAASQLQPPTLGVASNAGAGPAATTYVGIPTWLWLQGAWVSVTSPPAAVAGESVTATAAPTSVIWSMGDRHSTTCNGPGAPYNSADPSNPPCGYTYRIDSSRQPQDGPSVNDRYFTVQATVTWSVSWTCTGVACDQNGGVLPNLTIASPPARWRVFQIETVVTGGH
jgi:hypothetical protein